MRAAAVQLTPPPDRDRNLEAADRLTRAAAQAGAELVVLPEKWPVLGTPEQTAAGAEPLDGPALHLGARRPRASSASTSSPARSPSASTAPTRGANTSVHFGPDGEAARRLPQDPHVRRRGRRARSTASPSTRRRATRSSLSETAGGVELGPEHLLRPALPRALPRSSPCAARACSPCRPRSRSPRRASTGRSSCAPARSRTRRSWSPPTRSASTRPGIRSGGRSMIVDPWGVVLAQAPDAETFVDRRARPRAPGRDPPHAAVARQPPARRLPLAAARCAP